MAAPSRGSRRAPAAPVRARPARRSGPVVASPSGRSPASTHRRPPRRWCARALRSALSDRASAGKVAVIDAWSFDAPKTKAAIAALGALGVDGRVLVVLTRDDEAAYVAFRNLPDVQPMLVGELNAYDVLCNDWIVFTTRRCPARRRHHG